MASQAIFSSLWSSEASSSNISGMWSTSSTTTSCGWPLEIISDHRDLDLTTCFEHAVLMPVPLAITILGAIAQIISKRRRLKRPNAKDGLRWIDRNESSRKVCTAKVWLLGISALLATAALGLSLPSLTTNPLSSVHYLLYLITLLFLIHLTPLNFYTARQSSTLVLLFWPVYLLVSIVRLRTMIITGYLSLELTKTTDGRLILARESLWIASIIIGMFDFVLELSGPETKWNKSKWSRPFSKSKGKIHLDDSDEEADTVGQLNGGRSSNGRDEYGDIESPVLTANFYEKLTFSWLTPMLSLGTKKFLGEEDMWSLPPSDSAEALSERLSTAWEKQLEYVKKGSKSKPSLKIAILRAYGGPYITAGILKLAYDSLSFVQPQLLRLLLRFVTSYGTDSPMPPIAGYAVTILMFVTSNIATATLHQYFDRCFATTMRVKGGLVTLIYKKSLRLSNGEKAGRTTGDIVNLQSVDAVRIADLAQYGQIGWSGPFQIVLAFISLYNLVGWQAFMGVAIMVVSLPINTFLAKVNKKNQNKMMKIKDTRTRLMTEILNNIKSIKLYGWEKSFAEKVLDSRNNKELVLLRRIGLIGAASNFFWSSTPFLVAFATFATFVATSDRPLTSEIIFPAISLFQLLSFPMAVFSNIINSIIEAIVSVKRIEDFLGGDELDPKARQVIINPPGQGPKIGEPLVTIRDGEFKWINDSPQPILQDIDLKVNKGELLAVIGRVGDGKSSLLGAMLGEMTRVDGSVKIQGDIAYFSQNSWILSATVKDNIVFGHRFDPEFYDQVIEACALKPDFEVLPQGDMTEVGEKGVSLSGGQKARIALARACYARADIYLLDDPLSAVDAHVGRHIFDQVIGPNGMLRSKARVLCTNSVSFLPQADQVIMLRRGIILERGTYQDAMANNQSELYKLITGLGKQTEKGESSGSATPTVVGNGSDDEVEDDEGDESDENEKMPDSPQKERMVRRGTVSKMRRASSISIKQAKRDALRDLRESSKPKEHSEKGVVKRKVYAEYISAASKVGVSFFLLFMIAGQTASILSNYVLRFWAQKNTSAGDNTQVTKYLLAYGLMGISSSLLSVLSTIVLKLYCALRSSRKLHDAGFRALMRSPLAFFEITPTGRILNLFSRDIYVIDEVLVNALSGFMRTCINVLGVIVVIASGAPFVLIVLLPLGYIYRVVMKYYLATSRELKRLDAISRSPIFSFFGETLSGLTVIRGFSQTRRFIANNEARIDRNQACYMPAMTVNRWLAVRLEFLGSCLMFSTALVAVSALLISNSVDAGLVGLLMTYTMSITQALNWLVRTASEVEQNIVSVERVLGYASLPSEAADDVPDHRPPKTWPQKGGIEFNDYSLKYRPELEPALRQVSFSIKGGERIGVVGRTGAGKSSLTLALFRILEAAGGKISIDGVDISKIGLHDLRSVVSIIPQDPQLFEGTLRHNIDPTNSHKDANIWQALEQAYLKDHIMDNMGGTLDAEISEGGQNLSSGQRQLVCFARALLRKTKILVLDEATSSIDLETDEAVQQIIRGSDFEGVTTLTIAHRINTIMDSDRVLVMSNGKVAEYDSPDVLLQNPDSIFQSMVQEAGLGQSSSSASRKNSV
ncbi:putative metal resistance protein ycf1 [Kockovaella imperatae]|uniref:Putative metal resistance protein ycf1 n=1 Tax=Kockovaella imperatae TaxID=4999 RepID=A0A1Y1UBI8_9TREE|nr:putative metal resistance protein ycf1 [Kockovaella imperatae]ORX35410.1 putative metal resistance protein ycf1 [Kockovaella imperatae]